MTEHYLTKSPKSELIITKTSATLRGKKTEFYTASGLFSKAGVDKGSAILINNCLIKNNWKVLDLGCGYGVVGLALLNANKTLQLTFSDINERAVQITKMNLKLNNLKGEVIQSDGFENIKNKFDTILLNPPQTAGKELCFKLIIDSKKYLEENGTLQIVARHNKGGKSLSEKMNETFGNVKTIAKISGFHIYVSENKL
jgi:16S rRNA (guanine1207-N2)-methyltransferase